MGFGKPQRAQRKQQLSVPPCPLWLISFAIIRVHPEKIKKPRKECEKYYV
jgi:hypothetical protein